MKEECKIIKDLLPNYIEGLTSEETNKFIEEHLKKCEDCKKLKNVYQNENIELRAKEDNNNRKKVKIFKKVNKKIRILQAIIVSIMVIYLAMYIKNLVTLNKIVDLADNNDFSNYYKKEVKSSEKVIYKREYYQNDNNFLYVNTTIHSNNNVERNIEGMFNGKRVYYCEVNGIVKSVDELSSIEIKPVSTWQWSFVNEWGNLGLALVPGIVKSTTLNKRECYLMELEGDLFYTDKKTGMEIKRINHGDNSVYDRKYSFGTVTDEQIKEIMDMYLK